MSRPTSMFDLFDRAVMNVKVKIENTHEGRCRTIVSTLYDTVIWSCESANEAEAERHLREAGFKRIPPYVASEIDILR